MCSRQSRPSKKAAPATGRGPDMDLAELWGTDQVPTRYAGHDGLAFSPRPTEFVDLFAGAQRWADREFLVQGERRIRHGQFRAAISFAAALLERHGLGQGDRVLLLSYNSPEFVLATWALWRLGAIPVFGNRWWS